MSKLVLARKAGESVKIGESLVLTIREVHAKKVYLQPNNGKALWFELQQDFSVVLGTSGVDVKVTICAINKGVVKLLFEADRSVTIVRTELLK